MIWAIENRLQNSHAALKNATDDQIAQFRNGLTELERRANRLERHLNEGFNFEMLAS